MQWGSIIPLSDLLDRAVRALVVASGTQNGLADDRDRDQGLPREMTTIIRDQGHDRGQGRGDGQDREDLVAVKETSIGQECQDDRVDQLEGQLEQLECQDREDGQDRDQGHGHDRGQGGVDGHGHGQDRVDDQDRVAGEEDVTHLTSGLLLE